MKPHGFLTLQFNLGGKEICRFSLSRLEYETIRRFGFRTAIERVVKRVVEREVNQRRTGKMPGRANSAILDTELLSMQLRQFLTGLHQNRYRIQKK